MLFRSAAGVTVGVIEGSTPADGVGDMPAGVYNGIFGSTVVVGICDGADETAGYGVPDGSVVCAFASFAGICVKNKAVKRSHTSCFLFFCDAMSFPP